MKTELARLKESDPNMAHTDRYIVVLFHAGPLFTIHTGLSWPQGTGSIPKSRHCRRKKGLPTRKSRRAYFNSGRVL